MHKITCKQSPHKASAPHPGDPAGEVASIRAGARERRGLAADVATAQQHTVAGAAHSGFEPADERKLRAQKCTSLKTHLILVHIIMEVQIIYVDFRTLLR